MRVHSVTIILLILFLAAGAFWAGSPTPAQAQCGIGGSSATQTAPGSTGSPNPLGGLFGSNSGASGQPSPENPVANGVIGLFIAAVVVGGGGYILHNERRKQRGAALTASISAEGPALLSNLSQLSPDGLEALDAILEDPAQAEEIFLSLIDLDLETLKGRSPSERRRAVQSTLTGRLSSQETQ